MPMHSCWSPTAIRHSACARTYSMPAPSNDSVDVGWASVCSSFPTIPDTAAAITRTDTARSAALLGERRLSMATITTPKITSHAGHSWWRQVLLGCGVVAPVWWVAMDVVGSLRYEGYSYIDQ